MTAWAVHRVDEEDGSISFEVWGGESDPMLTVRESEFYDVKTVAEKIVRAVNSHGELLAALKAFAALRDSGLLIEGDAAVSTALDCADAAIAKAEAR